MFFHSKYHKSQVLNQVKMPKRKSYSVTDKLAVIASIKRAASQGDVSCDDDVPESTIRGWLRDKEKLCDFVEAIANTEILVMQIISRFKAKFTYDLIYLNDLIRSPT